MQDSFCGLASVSALCRYDSSFFLFVFKRLAKRGRYTDSVGVWPGQNWRQQAIQARALRDNLLWVA